MTIGKTTTYVGKEPGLKFMINLKVRIVAVLRNAAKPGIDLDGPEYDRLDDDRDIKAIGEHDRIEVQPWIENESRYSWITSDPKAVDLECFAHLTR